MSRILEDCPNTIRHMDDDMLLPAEIPEEQDQHLNTVLSKLQEANFMLKIRILGISQELGTCFVGRHNQV